MSEPNEIVAVEMSTADRIRISNQIFAKMEGLGFAPYDYDKLKLGFHLPTDWPAAGELTLAQLVVVAKRLDLKVTINNINLEPHIYQEEKS